MVIQSPNSGNRRGTVVDFNLDKGEKINQAKSNNSYDQVKSQILFFF